MLRQYLSFILVTAITAATVNAGCCIVSPPPNTECADTSELTCKQAGGSWRSSSCTLDC
ncbi:hypothetical protein PTTW11_03134 [Pyrenophora teres f. teres]|uniref:Uncharacterized protein n=1 Tax=Pyrenophora teres f. teres TaxID=97479 RepID=A0A6S6VX29_9PLEO|nr:hypothetical protein PTTW11_03134 [Pyrenophora teres f. teres]